MATKFVSFLEMLLTLEKMSVKYWSLYNPSNSVKWCSMKISSCSYNSNNCIRIFLKKTILLREAVKSADLPPLTPQIPLHSCFQATARFDRNWRWVTTPWTPVSLHNLLLKYLTLLTSALHVVKSKWYIYIFLILAFLDLKVRAYIVDCFCFLETLSFRVWHDSRLLLFLPLIWITPWLCNVLLSLDFKFWSSFRAHCLYLLLL